MSAEPFKRLAKLVGRAFYDDIPPRSENQPKIGRSDNRGMAVVVIDALTRKQWVKEDDLAKELKLHSKQLRRILRHFEEDRLISRDHRKETAKGAKVFNAAVAATADGQQNGKENEEKMKLHTHSYCCLDYAQIYDVVRYRIHRIKKKLKDELEDKNTVQEYICPNCNRRYSALDALLLVSYNQDSFHCENCNTELVAESDKFAAEEKGEGDDNGRRGRRERVKELLEKMELQLKPLSEQLGKVKDLQVPEFGSLLQWEARALAGRATISDINADEGRTSSQGQGYGGTPMPFLGETKVEVAISGNDIKTEDSKDDVAGSKVLPPWMVKQGMNITSEQKGEVKPDIKPDIKPFVVNGSTDQKPSAEDQAAAQKRIQEEYLQAYYLELYKQQNKASAGADASETETKSERQVGMKSKHEDEDEVEWEEDSTIGADAEVNEDWNTKSSLDGASGQVGSTELENKAVEDEDDEIDWEDG